jgi:hypothetical protein
LETCARIARVPAVKAGTLIVMTRIRGLISRHEYTSHTVHSDVLQRSGPSSLNMGLQDQINTIAHPTTTPTTVKDNENPAAS